MLETDLSLNDMMFLARGAGVTLLITAISVAGGTLLGIIFGVARMNLGRVVSGLLAVILDVFRSVPLLIQLILANAFQAIAGLGLQPFTTACVVLALYTAALCSEIVRGAIGAVPTTTRRASRSLGMTWTQDMTYVVWPMALRVGLPSWIGLVLSVLKDSALVFWLGIIELLRSSQILITRLQEPMTILLIAGAIYFIISFPIARLGGHLERKWREND
ncbi:amino acid ABC transporter permease [Aliiroseovarius sediminis]|uniref:amino acid ABC transporter permease n=1 Tax=Aliiroseovarius sediminis TaxID=2925839 RepID=UPI001F599CC5|nr:amino acid ABC transporter permease [Aliiroseovarius sediminis]MCI2393840.1 amino acid ABC transporter permease [Aliiroseovarius sediminis]